MRSKMERRLFMWTLHKTNICQTSYNLSWMEGGRGGGSEIESRVDISKRFQDMNRLTRIEHLLKISIRFSLKWSPRFFSRFAVIGSQIPMNRRNSPKARLGPLIPLLVSTRTTSSKKLDRKKTNAVRWVKTLMDYLFFPWSFNHIVDSLLPSYGVCHSIYIPIYILFG